MLLTKKTVAVLGSRINDNASGSEVSAFARKQMEKMGWTEGKGLGKTESGTVSHIKVKKIEDNEGIGAREQKIEKSEESSTWWHDNFAAALKTMKVNGGKSSKKSSKKGKDDKSSSSSKKKRKLDEVSSDAPPSFDDLFKATGGARLGMRARANQKGKWERSEKLDNPDTPMPASAASTPVVAQRAAVAGDVDAEKKSKKSRTEKKDREVVVEEEEAKKSKKSRTEKKDREVVEEEEEAKKSKKSKKDRASKDSKSSKSSKGADEGKKKEKEKKEKKR